MRDRLQRWLPTEEKLRALRSVRWLGPVLRRPWLWQLTRRRVAAGAAVGVFFGLLIPVLQIPCAALGAVTMRANLPVAVVATLVSNPLTYAPIFVAAHRTGTALLGSVDDVQSERSLAEFAEQIEADGGLPRTGGSGRSASAGRSCSGSPRLPSWAQRSPGSASTSRG